MNTYNPTECQTYESKSTLAVFDPVVKHTNRNASVIPPPVQEKVGAENFWVETVQPSFVDHII